MNCCDCEFMDYVKSDYISNSATLFYINFDNGIWIAVCEDHKIPNLYKEMGYVLVDEGQFKKSLLLK